jgi:hypothetical protein
MCWSRCDGSVWVCCKWQHLIGFLARLLLGAACALVVAPAGTLKAHLHDYLCYRPLPVSGCKWLVLPGPGRPQQQQHAWRARWLMYGAEEASPLGCLLAGDGVSAAR